MPTLFLKEALCFRRPHFFSGGKAEYLLLITASWLLYFCDICLARLAIIGLITSPSDWGILVFILLNISSSFEFTVANCSASWQEYVRVSIIFSVILAFCACWQTESTYIKIEMSCTVHTWLKCCFKVSYLPWYIFYAFRNVCIVLYYLPFCVAIHPDKFRWNHH